MRLSRLLVVLGAASFLIFATAYSLPRIHKLAAAESAAFRISNTQEQPTPGAGAIVSRYRLDPSASKFMAHASRSGLLWFKGHGHHIAIPDFNGEAVLDPGSLSNSSLTIIAKSASMEETSDVFTAAQKQIINKELRDIVLLPEQYPEITFKSSQVTGTSTTPGQYDLKINGNLTLLGVTRPIIIPTKVTVNGDQMRAQGEFSINRDDFKVKATSAFHGLVRVSNKVSFRFDIVGRR
jgi:polyisoprenoid-binding protein YceI